MVRVAGDPTRFQDEQGVSAPEVPLDEGLELVGRTICKRAIRKVFQPGLDTENSGSGLQFGGSEAAQSDCRTEGAGLAGGQAQDRYVHARIHQRRYHGAQTEALIVRMGDDGKDPADAAQRQV
ncbi:MAG: hypothetical protein NVS3B18_08750 [Candidatus Dormibacteria bacterium]